MSAADEILGSPITGRSAVRALVAIDAEIDREMIEALMTTRENQISVVDYVDLERDGQGRDGGGDVLLVGCTEFNAGIGQLVRTSRQRHPSRPVLLMCPFVAGGFVRDAFEAGADDIVAVPSHADPELVSTASRELMFAIEKALARRRGTPVATRQTLGRMICVLGLKGGVGKTLVASNLGVALASAGHSVTIVDLDLQFGDVGLAMGLAPERTSYDLVRSGGSLDGEKVGDFLMTHSSGARVLLSPVRPDQGPLVTPDFLKAVERVLRETNEFVVVDTPPAFTAEVISAVDASTDVVMVTMRDSLALKNTKLALETLQRMGYDRSRVKLLLNRANTDVGIERQDLLTILGSEVDVRLLSDRDITRSVNRGEPVALNRRSEAAKVFHHLAELYGDDLPASNGKPPEPVATTKRRRPALRMNR
jgi:pilus assembly protein CpaE